MENFNLWLTIVSVVLGIVVVAAVWGGIWLYKRHKNTLEQEKQLKDKLSEIDQNLLLQGDKINDTDAYNKAMGVLILEEQKVYLQGVVNVLSGFIRKNQLLVKHNLIQPSVGDLRNAQLSVLKTSLNEYAKQLAQVTEEPQKIENKEENV